MTQHPGRAVPEEEVVCGHNCHFSSQFSSGGSVWDIQMRSSKKSVAIFCPNFWSRFSKILFWYFWSIEYVWNDGCASQFWWSLIWPPNSCSAAYSDYWWKIFYLRDYLISSQIISNTRSVWPETEDLVFQIQGLNIWSSNEWKNVRLPCEQNLRNTPDKKYTW